MKATEDLRSWIRDERVRIERRILLFSCGKARLTEARSGRMLDVSGEALKDLKRRKDALDLLLEEN